MCCMNVAQLKSFTFTSKCRDFYPKSFTVHSIYILSKALAVSIEAFDAVALTVNRKTVLKRKQAKVIDLKVHFSWLRKKTSKTSRAGWLTGLSG